MQIKAVYYIISHLICTKWSDEDGIVCMYIGAGYVSSLVDGWPLVEARKQKKTSDTQ